MEESRSPLSLKAPPKCNVLYIIMVRPEIISVGTKGKANRTRNRRTTTDQENGKKQLHRVNTYSTI
jgi:hypothetical protein